MSVLAAPRLDGEFFARPVCEVAEALIGARLLVDGVGGTIVETEAYHQDEPACHGHRGPTPRSEVMFGPPGVAYVYLSYGIHRLFNIVTAPAGVGAAVLIRALEPTDALAAIRTRRGERALEELCSGPGKLTEALAITLADNRRTLGARIVIEPRPASDPAPALTASPRIGISRARELPWRYSLAASRFVSPPRPPVQSRSRSGSRSA